MTGGTAKLVGTDSDQITSAAAELLTNPVAYSAMANAINPFGDGSASTKILAAVEKFLEK